MIIGHAALGETAAFRGFFGTGRCGLPAAALGALVPMDFLALQHEYKVVITWNSRRGRCHRSSADARFPIGAHGLPHSFSGSHWCLLAAQLFVSPEIAANRGPRLFCCVGHYSYRWPSAIEACNATWRRPALRPL